MSENEIDHYIWEGYYIPHRYDNPSDSVYATTLSECQHQTTENAGIIEDYENDGWEKNENVDYPLYQIHDSEHHIVTVVRRPVYGDTYE